MSASGAKADISAFTRVFDALWADSKPGVARAASEAGSTRYGLEGPEISPDDPSATSASIDVAAMKPL
jgi:hypothetical protein